MVVYEVGWRSRRLLSYYRSRRQKTVALRVRLIEKGRRGFDETERTSESIYSIAICLEREFLGLERATELLSVLLLGLIFGLFEC